MSSLSNLDKGLVQKVLDLYFLYCELELPFKIGDHFELFEFDLIFLSSRTMTMYDTYKYARELKINLRGFKLDSAILTFNWDELVETDLSLIKTFERVGNTKTDEVLEEVFITESISIVERIKLLKIKYVIGLEWVELTIYK